MERTTTEYTEFKLRNRIKVNRYLNYVLWFFAIAAPAIAAGIKAGFFHDVTYATCVNTFIIVVVLSAIHLILFKKFPMSIVTSLFALTAVNVLLVYMDYSNISIYMTWFLVPLLSLLFCDSFIFGYAVVLNYVLMVITTVISAPYHLQIRADYDDVASYAADVLGGFTIETLVMVASGFIILKLTMGYYSELFDQYTVIRDQQRSMNEKMEILDSMAEIYDNVNLIDFVENTETSLRDPEQKKHAIHPGAQTHTLMNQRIKERIMPDQLEAFLTFTDIGTVRSRLKNKKLISAEFIDVVSGWFRAQYITVESSPEGVPSVVIYTTRNVDEEKRREENLVRIAMTDEMTRLFNRRSYEEDLIEHRRNGLSEDIVLFSLDVDGLKPVNDTNGHAAGDELIRGAADCLALSIGNSGKAYRTGGDEFIAVVHTNDPEKIRESIMERSHAWRGQYSERVSVSVGYAAKKGRPDASIDDLEHDADADMYKEKEKHYREKGIARRQ